MRSITDSELRRAGPHELIQFLSVLIDHKYRHLGGPHQNTLNMGITRLAAHRTDAGLFRDLVLVGNIYCIEFDSRDGGILRDLLKDRAYSPAGTAPGCIEVDDYGHISVYLMLEGEGTSSR